MEPAFDRILEASSDAAGIADLTAIQFPMSAAAVRLVQAYTELDGREKQTAQILHNHY